MAGENARTIFVFDGGQLKFLSDYTDNPYLFSIQHEASVDTSTTPKTWTSKLIITPNQSAQNADKVVIAFGTDTVNINTEFFGDVTINGNLLVTGTIDTVNQVNLEVQDKYIYLNHPSDDASYVTPDMSGIVVDVTFENPPSDRFAQSPKIYWKSADNTWYVGLKSESGAVEFPIAYGNGWYYFKANGVSIEPTTHHDTLTFEAGLTTTNNPDGGTNLVVLADQATKTITYQLNKELHLSGVYSDILESDKTFIAQKPGSGETYGKVKIGDYNNSPTQPEGPMAIYIPDKNTKPLTVIITDDVGGIPSVATNFNADYLDGHDAQDFLSSLNLQNGSYTTTSAINANNKIPFSNFGLTVDTSKAKLYMLYINGRKLLKGNDASSGDWHIVDPATTPGIALHFDIPANVTLEVIIFNTP